MEGGCRVALRREDAVSPRNPAFKSRDERGGLQPLPRTEPPGGLTVMLGADAQGHSSPRFPRRVAFRRDSDNSRATRHASPLFALSDGADDLFLFLFWDRIGVLFSSVFSGLVRRATHSA